MRKFLLFFAINLFLLNIAFSKTRNADTTILFFRQTTPNNSSTVHSIDSADYIMLILPPDAHDTRYNIKQFYKNGKIKFIGKADFKTTNFNRGIITFDGDCTSYYRNGKKYSISHFDKGLMDGSEFLFYPSGAIYCTKKHLYNGQILKWECYDENANMICQDGNGRWIEYDDSCKNIKMEGQVVKGYMEGEWTGKVWYPDTIRYVYHYKKSLFRSAMSYDKNGKVYPFEDDIEFATFKNGNLRFADRLHNRIKVPVDANGETISVDTIHVSFIVEKNGEISQLAVPGNVHPDLKASIIYVLSKCTGWHPLKLFGIPYRARVTFPLKEMIDYNDDGTAKGLSFYATVVKDD